MQHDYILDNQAGAAFRADLNNALSAIVTHNSGSTEPTIKYAYQFWVDTSVTPALLKMRNGGNTAWITIGDATAANLGLVTTSALSAYATVASLASYATTASLSAYAPVAGPTFTGNVALSGGNLSVVGQGGSAPITLTDASTIAWNANSGQTATVTLGGNRTMGAPTNLINGFYYLLTIVQDGTGSRTVTWNSIFRFTGNTAPTLSTAAGSVDQVAFRYDGTYLREIGRSLGGV